MFLLHGIFFLLDGLDVEVAFRKEGSGYRKYRNAQPAGPSYAAHVSKPKFYNEAVENKPSLKSKILEIQLNFNYLLVLLLPTPFKNDLTNIEMNNTKWETDRRVILNRSGRPDVYGSDVCPFGKSLLFGLEKLDLKKTTFKIVSRASRSYNLLEMIIQ